MSSKSPFLLLLPCVVMVAGCPEPEKEEKAPQKSEPLDLTVNLKAGEVRCGPVTHADELIGGPVAYGQVGRSFKCYNDQIRFLVQDHSRPMGVSSLGGSIIDVDLVRDNSPESGADTFKEMVPAPGTGEVMVETMQVVNDGTNGEPAVLRVTGRQTPNTIVPTTYFIYQEILGEVQTDYILRPDVNYIEIKTTIFNETDDFIGPLLMGDFVSFGGGTRPYTPEYGFDEVPMFTDIGFFAGVLGDHVSYAYACPNGPALAPIVEKGITAPVCDDELIVAYEETSSRFLYVGDGSLESVAKPIWDMQEVALATVEGIVVSPDNVGLANIHVSALTQSISESGARVVNQARTGLDGSFSLHLPEGNYTFIAHHLEHQRSNEVALTVVAGQKDNIELQMQGRGQLIIETDFFDLSGDAMQKHPAKLSIMPNEGVQLPHNALGEWVAKGLSNYHLSTDGSFDVQVPPGDYTVYVSRGFTFSRFATDITISHGNTVNVAAELRQAIDTTGFVGTEFHQHSLGSVDANVPIPTRVLENAAEGIQFAAATEHDNIIDFQPFIEALGVADFIRAVPGNEVTYTGGLGHFNVYPWDVNPEDPYRDLGSHIWFMTTASTLFEKIRSLAGDPLIQVNHPRSGYNGYFSQMGLNPVDGSFAPREEATIPVLPPKIYLDWSNDFEVIEVNGNLGSPSLFTEESRASLADLALNSPDSVPVLADYMALLGSGRHVVATGNSDAHTANNTIGYPRSFVRIDETNFNAWNKNDVRDAMRAQRAAVGQGCLVLFKHQDKTPMGLPETLTSEEATSLEVLVQAPSFVSLNRIEIYINGIIQNIEETGEDGLQITSSEEGAIHVPLTNTGSNSTTARYRKTLKNLPDKDLIIIAVVRGGSGLAPTGHGSPFCFSGPTYVDSDGAGFEPWLTGSEF
ncbi:MAG: hypothetical protein CMH56_14000 [Myxococcales bacterium]|nr:hypothetical protein [Myxococcales bacterium]|tara:strand:+ start:1520 stop:4264 length:2745 start_codon:yes stop_codon:yes gene_type:complete